MIIIQTNRIFLVPENTDIPKEPIIPIEAKIERKKEHLKVTKKAVKYFIPEFYI